MGGFLDKVANWLKFDRFANMFRDHEEFIMTKGLRMIAVGCLVISLVYVVFTYIEFTR